MAKHNKKKTKKKKSDKDDKKKLKHNKHGKPVKKKPLTDKDKAKKIVMSQFDLEEQFITAVQGGDWSYAGKLMRRGVDVTVRDNIAVKYAAEQGRTDVVEALLDKGADLHASDDLPLRDAAQNGHLKTVKLLIDRGADIAAEDNEALRNAAEKGHTDVARVLLEYGADIHADDDYALRWAAENGHADTVQLLLEYGADMDADDGYAREWADRYGHEDVVEILDKWAQTPKDQRVDRVREKWAREFAKTFGEDFKLADLDAKTDARGSTGYHLAARAGLIGRVAEQARKEGAKALSFEALTRKDKAGETPLSLAGRQGNLDKVFVPELWKGRRAEMDKLWAEVDLDDRGQVDIEAVRNRLTIMDVHRRIDPGRKLKPGGPK